MTKKKKIIVLAFGEATGHKHVLESEEVETIQTLSGPNGEEITMFDLGAEGTITHEEHHTRILPPGKYDKSFVIEYDPVDQSVRNLID